MDPPGKIKKGASGRKGAAEPVRRKSRFRARSRPVIELAGNAARDNKKNRIILRNLLLAIRNDEELGKLLAGLTIALGGVLPNINPILLPKKFDKSTSEPKSSSKATKSPKKA